MAISKDEMNRIRDKANKGQRLEKWEAEELTRSSRIAGSNDSTQAIKNHLTKTGK